MIMHLTIIEILEAAVHYEVLPIITERAKYGHEQKECYSYFNHGEMISRLVVTRPM